MSLHRARAERRPRWARSSRRCAIERELAAADAEADEAACELEAYAAELDERGRTSFEADHAASMAPLVAEMDASSERITRMDN